MTTQIKCPNCSHQFEPNEAIREEVEKELRAKAADWQKKKNEEFQLKLDEEKKKIHQSLEENIRRSLTADFDNQLKVLQQSNKDNEEKLKLARQKELEFLNKMQELKTKEEEIELNIKRRLNEEREKLSVEIRDLEKQKLEQLQTEFNLRIAEKDKQLEDQKKLAEEALRKAQQGSMQTQGEVQELMLEYALRENFPFDIIEEVKKGVEGADCIMTVRNHLGEECGKIIFESKRTKSWGGSWIEKLKSDMRSTQADLAILVSQVFPKDMNCFGEKEGIWICSFREVIALTSALRTAVIRVAEAKRNEENKTDKTHMLYAYVTGIEFRQQIESIVEGFVALRNSIVREKIQMEKIWKEREKQLDKVLASTSGVYGSIKGIAGASVNNIPLLEGDEDTNLLPID